MQKQINKIKCFSYSSGPATLVVCFNWFTNDLALAKSTCNPEKSCWCGELGDWNSVDENDKNMALRNGNFKSNQNKWCDKK